MSGCSSRRGGTGRCADQDRARVPTTARPAGPGRCCRSTRHRIWSTRSWPIRSCRLKFIPTPTRSGPSRPAPRSSPTGTRPTAQALPRHPPPALPGGLRAALRRHRLPAGRPTRCARPASSSGGGGSTCPEARRAGGPRAAPPRRPAKRAPRSSASWRRCGSATAAPVRPAAWRPARRGAGRPSSTPGVGLHWVQSGGQRAPRGLDPPGWTRRAIRRPLPGCGAGPPRAAAGGRRLAGSRSRSCPRRSRRRRTRSARSSPTRPTPTPTPPATIYFGLVPTGSSDVDDDGHARFDDDSSYEIRCFVRRHKAACPRTGPQCHCPITWSDPTEGYQLAPHFDLRGHRQPAGHGAAARPREAAVRRLTQPLRLRRRPLQRPPRAQMPFTARPDRHRGGAAGRARRDLLVRHPAHHDRGHVRVQAVPADRDPRLPALVHARLKFCIPPEVDVGGGFGAELDARRGLNVDAGAVAAIDADQPTSTARSTSCSAGPRTAGRAWPTRSQRGQPGCEPSHRPPSPGSLLRGMFAASAAPPKAADFAPAGRAQRGGPMSHDQHRP